MVFVATIIITTIALAQPVPIVWVSYIPLIPLFLLLGTGIYMFVLPYAQRWRARG
jgi:hypothetical protein